MYWVFLSLKTAWVFWVLEQKQGPVHEPVRTWYIYSITWQLHFFHRAAAKVDNARKATIKNIWDENKLLGRGGREERAK